MRGKRGGEKKRGNRKKGKKWKNHQVKKSALEFRVTGSRGSLSLFFFPLVMDYYGRLKRGEEKKKKKKKMLTSR